VAERFREFSGRKSLAAFTALFADTDPLCRQAPPVVIADGRRTARIVIRGIGGGDGASRFTVSGGRLISAERGAKGEWLLVVQPNEKAWDVKITCTTAGEAIGFPDGSTRNHIPPQRLTKLNEKSFMSSLRLPCRKAGWSETEAPVWLQEYLLPRTIWRYGWSG
jgi:hypothetical protein